MTIDAVRRFFKEKAPDLQVIEHQQSTATVARAAEVLGVAQAQITKTLALTGHSVGGVCPFAVDNGVKIYCDVSLQTHEEIYPAADSSNSVVLISPDRLAKLVDAQWVDIGKT